MRWSWKTRTFIGAKDLGKHRNVATAAITTARLK